MKPRVPKHRRALSSLVASLGVVALAACAGSGADGARGSSVGDVIENMDPVVMSFATVGTEKGAASQGVLSWQEAVTERTDGKVTFDNFYSGSLLGATDAVSGVGSGVADMAGFIPSYTPHELPANTWFEGLGRSVSSSPVHDVVAAGAALHEFVLNNETLSREYEQHNVKLMNISASTAYNRACNRPMESLEDASGARARSSGPVWTETAEALGMVPVTLSIADAYEGLQRGVIECMIFVPNGLLTTSLTEVATEFVPVAFAQAHTAIAMNLDTWGKLPVEVQAIMLEESMNAAPVMWRENLVQDAPIGEMLQDGRLRANDPTALAAVADAQRDEWLSEMVATAPTSIEDPQAIIDEYLERVAYWTAVLEDVGFEVRSADNETLDDTFLALEDIDLTEFVERFDEEVSATEAR